MNSTRGGGSAAAATDTNRPPNEVLIVGPHMYRLGGTQSVIRTISDCRIGADRIRVLATWDGPNHVTNTRLVARAARAIANLDTRTIVHAHMSNGGAWLRDGSLIAFARSRGLRVVVTLHGWEFPEFAVARPRFVRAVLGKAHHVICLSDEGRDAVQRLLPDKPVSILANPVAVDLTTVPADETPPVALFAGTIGRRKGVDVLVDAWRQVVARGVEGHCRVIGEIDDYTPPTVDRMSLEAQVHPNEITELLRSVRVVVLPSRAEAMPMILTEALAGARPFIATPVGNIRDITPDESMIVPVEDPQALADAITRYLTDPKEARRAGDLGQRYIMDTRSPEVIDARLRQIYSTL